MGAEPHLSGEERATELSQPYWTALRAGHLVLQQCSSCHRWQHYPRRLCRFCHGPQLGWAGVSGRGTVLMSTTVYRTTRPELREHVPYRLALVRLREGPVLMVLLAETGPELRVGSAVELDGTATIERGLLTFGPARRDDAQ
jgi:uncharacterized OB-fold protein